MFLRLNHQTLDIYAISRALVFECYKLSSQLPPEERFGMVSQIRRAALSIHLNLAEGSSRKSSVERKRFFEVARGSIIEIDAALDIAYDLGYLTTQDLNKTGELMLRCFQILSGLIKSNSFK